MHLSYSTLPLAATTAASLYLLLQGDKKYATVAFIVSLLELLLALHIITFSIVKFRVDLIMAAVLAVAGCLCWGKSSSKGAVTASTIVSLIGLMQLVLALRLFD